MNRIIIQPKTLLLIGFFVLLGAYSLYQARFLIVGPQITINDPQTQYNLSDGVVTLEGQSKNISWISLNDHQIFTDENGNWSEKLIVSTGMSIMTVKARDRFGRETEKSVAITLPDKPLYTEQIVKN